MSTVWATVVRPLFARHPRRAHHSTAGLCTDPADGYIHARDCHPLWAIGGKFRTTSSPNQLRRDTYWDLHLNQWQSHVREFSYTRSVTCSSHRHSAVMPFFADDDHQVLIVPWGRRGRDVDEALAFGLAYTSQIRGRTLNVPTGIRDQLQRKPSAARASCR